MRLKSILPRGINYSYLESVTLRAPFCGLRKSINNCKTRNNFGITIIHVGRTCHPPAWAQGFGNPMEILETLASKVGVEFKSKLRH